MPNLLRRAFPLLTTVALGAMATAQARWDWRLLMWARSGHTMACNPATGELLVSGGSAGSIALPTLWRFDADHWSLLSMQPFYQQEMVFDPVAQLYVLFDASGFVSTWDGSVWGVLPMPTGVSGRRLAAYDPLRAVTTLVVSSPTSTQVQDWNGTSWTQRATTGATPPWNINGRLVHDPRSGTLLSLTSFPPGTPLQVWSLSATSWQQIVTPVSPPPLEHFAAARDPVTGDVLVFGGYESIGGSAVARDQLWAFDGSSWRLVAAPPGPAARYEHAMVEDPANGRTLLYGGRTVVAGQTRFFGDLWSWNGSAWAQLAEAAAPIANGPLTPFAAPVAFDRPRQQIVLGPMDALGTMQTFDGASWATHPCAGSCPTAPVLLGYDEQLGLVVAAAGNGTFLWIGSAWALVHGPGSGPAVPADAAFASDGTRMILFGGTRNGAPSAETWAWTLSGWTQLTPAHSPPPSANVRMAAMPSRTGIVLVNGLTWWWDGIDWSQRVAAPWSAAANKALTYVAERDRVVAHGGVLLSTYQEDTWEWDGASWQQTGSLSGPRSAAPRLVEGPGDLVYAMPAAQSELWVYGSDAKSPVTTYGAGCVGSLGGIPSLAAQPWERPRLGESFTVALVNVPTLGSLLAIGFRDDQWGGQPLPLSLATIGMPGCAALVAMDRYEVAGSLAGRATWTLAVPADVALVGLPFFLQGVAVDPAANAAGMTVSNGLRCRIGQR